MIFAPEGSDTRDYARLNRSLDRVKSRVFMGNDAAFFGPLMSSLKFVWSTEVDTAAIDGVTLWWNPDFFDEAPKKYGSETFNEFVLRHELWHAGALHMLRLGNRCPDVWNIACDIRVNNDQKAMGSNWGSFPAFYRPEMDLPKTLSEEEIYDILKKEGGPNPKNPWGNGDMQGSGDNSKAINNVVRAITNAKMEGKPGCIPGNLESIVDTFLTPILPWEQLLMEWCSDLQNHEYSWARPNRRYSDIYLPSVVHDDGRLEHLMYFQDVSGSITDNVIQRFNSELKYVWDEMKPQTMTIVQFDTKITKVDVLKEGDTFTRIEILGRGGTCLRAVRQMIIDKKPTAAIIFSDMGVVPMEPLPEEIPVLWIAVNAAGAKIPFGKIVHIKV